MKVRIRCAGIVIHEESILLVEHLGENGDRFWVPPGGGCDDWENLTTCVEREIREEAGCTVAARSLVAIRQFKQRAKDRNSYEFFFTCDLLNRKAGISRSSSEMYRLGHARFVPLSELSNISLYPEEFKNIEWLKGLFSSPPPSPEMLCAEELSVSESRPAPLPVLPEKLIQQFPDFCSNSSLALLCQENSHSNNGPLTVKNDAGERLVLRHLPMDEGTSLLTLTNKLREICNLRLARPIYAKLSGCDETQKLFDCNDGYGFLVQEFCKGHNLGILNDIRDYDVRCLGRDCGAIQHALDEAYKSGAISPDPSHPLAFTLRKRFSLIRERLDPAGLPLPIDLGNWICEETERTLDALIKLGVTEFPLTLIDRDLNVRNSAVAFEKGLAVIQQIFDPDFCHGAAVDSLRNPSLSFASRTPRLTLDQILREDVNTLGGPRWMQFIGGYLDEYPLSIEEIMALPMLEKLEILLFRLFEDDPRYLVPAEYIQPFRLYTRDLVSRINNIPWEHRLRSLFNGRSTFLHVSQQPRKITQDTLESIKEIDFTTFLPPACGQGTRSYQTDDQAWVINISDNKTGSAGKLVVGEGYPFPFTRTEAELQLPEHLKDFSLSLFRVGRTVQESFRLRLQKLLSQIFPDYKINYNAGASLEDIRQTTRFLSEHRRGSFVISDPFRFKGDALYIGLYMRMLRLLNPAADFTVLTRNPGIFQLFDCDVAQSLADLPDSILAAILPIPIDDQWEDAFRMISALLARTRLVLLPQRNLVIRHRRETHTIDIFHTGEDDFSLEYSNISTYTWYGLHRLLPEKVALNDALHFMARVPVNSLAYDDRPFFINPVTSSELKNLSPDLCEAAVEQISKVFCKGGRPALLINAGDPENPCEAKLAETLVNRLQKIADIKIWHGKSMVDTVNMLTSVRFVITADTSIGHASGYKGVPSLVIWNTRRWDSTSPLNLAHQSPLGFGCLPRTIFNISATYDSTENHETIKEDQDRVKTAISLIHRLCLEGGNDLISDTLSFDSNELLLKVEQGIERSYASFQALPANLDELLLEVADASDEFLRKLKPETLSWLHGMSPPLQPEWIVARLRNPSLIALPDIQKQHRFVLDLWRGSPIRKLLAFIQ